MKKIFTTLFAVSAAFVASAQSPCSELFISEYAEGSSQNKAIEIYNPTSSPKSLTGYFLRRYNNGDVNFTAGGELALSGTIAPKGVWVVTNSQTTGSTGTCDPLLRAKADQLDGIYPAPTYFNGNDAVTLEFGTTRVDIFGKIGQNPGPDEAWSTDFPYDGAGTWITEGHTMIRKASVTGGITVNPDNFNPMAEYDTLPENSWDSLKMHTCVCITAGINEAKVKYVSVFPNPSNNADVTLSVADRVGKIELIDRSGRICAAFDNSEKVSTGYRFSTIGVLKGLYIVKAYMAGGEIGFSKLSVE